MTTIRPIIKGTLDYSDMKSGITLDLRPLDAADIPTNVYKVVGSDYVDTIIGNSTPNASIYGGKGDDTLSSTGFYTNFDGGSGVDTVTYADRYTPVSVDLSAGVSGDGQTFTSIENVIGGLSNNSLIGNDSVNKLVGNDLGDLLDGQGGADLMIGGGGNDVYYVDNVGDRVVEDAGGGDNDKVYSTISYILGDNVESLTLDGSAAINGTGNTLANYLFGNDAANALYGLEGNDLIRAGGGTDKLYGGDGNDTLVGGSGADYLYGGDGKDTFRFEATSDSKVSARDHIMDYTHGEDRIDLHLIDSSLTDAGNNSFHFIGTAGFSHDAGELRYEGGSAGLVIYGDTNGDGVSDFSISLDGYFGSLSKSDFLL